MKAYTVKKSFIGSPDGNRRWAFTQGEVVTDDDGRLSDALIRSALKVGAFEESKIPDAAAAAPITAGSVTLTESAPQQSATKPASGGKK